MEKKPIYLIDAEVLLQKQEDENISSVKSKALHKCDECESIFTRAGSLKSHKLKFHGGVKRFKCSTCGYLAYTEYVLKVHSRNHTEEYPYKCDICGYESKWSGHMKKHRFGHIKVKCDECDSTFTRTSNLERHKLKVHKHRFKCSTCGYLAFTESRLQKHLKVHDENFLYKCDTCDYVSKWSGHMLRHQITHGRSKPDHKCDECESTFTRASYLKNHKLVFHGNRFKCSTCGYLAFTELKLKKHLKVHTENLQYKCNLCDYSSKWSGHILRHQIAHRKDKSHKCDECESTFTVASTLKRHKLTVHEGGKRFDCSNCGFIPFSKSSLRRHVLVHLAENR